MRTLDSLKTLLRFAAKGDWEMIAYLGEAKLRGVDLGPANLDELALPQDRSYHHVNTGGSYLSRVLRTLPITPSDLVVDVGCGKGGAMLTLAKFPFARVDGIELSERAVSIARENLRKMGIEKSTIYHCDAARFTDYDRYNYLYMGHPFPAAVLAETLKIVESSLVRRPRGMVLIYSNSLSHDTIIASGFGKLSEFPGEWGPTMVYKKALQLG
jgi:SAM-dependent methyltransferase